jgi:ArsR family transcriptional regulator
VSIDLKIYDKKAAILRALGHPHRLCITKGLIENKCNVSKIQECLGIPQSTISQHIAKLKAAGILEGTRNGLEICYSVVDKDVISIVDILFADIDK